MSINAQWCTLPPDLDARVRARLALLRDQDVVRRIWACDPFVWTGADEDQWLGWLNLPVQQRADLAHPLRLARDFRHEGVSDLLLLGMGGSSLAPEVLKMTFGRLPGFPDLHVLDSTDPARIRAVERAIDLPRTVFIVASKSGSTLEPNILKHYFFDRVAQERGPSHAGRQFIAITDPGSKLEQAAERDGFRHVFFGVPSVGGRYSALSSFGLVPSALMGVDASRLLDRAESMARRCAPDEGADGNPALMLGTVLGVLAAHGHDKPTFILSPVIADFGAWLEQLLAESTGKVGKGLIPIDGEAPGPVEVYGTDRLFVYVRLESAPDPAQDAHVERLERAGQPVVRILVTDPYGLGEEFYRWEMATAVAGAVLGINPFDQPDVEESKIATRRLAAEYEKSGRLPQESPLIQGGGLSLFADKGNREALGTAAGQSIAGCLRAHLGRLGAGDYFALLAYLEMSDTHTRALQAIRHLVRDRTRVATCLGFGPRFLHSTGQAYKGGPGSGVFLQVTCDDTDDLPVPGQKYTFGVIKAAQARGDLEVLGVRRRRALRVHIGRDIERGLAALRTAVEQALA
jgi:transaldolase / glucose-6-phosphate isomerase